MFVDASAIISIIAGEDDADSLMGRLSRAPRQQTSAIAIFEAAAGLARIGKVPPLQALRLVNRFLAEASVSVVSIDQRTADDAVEAFARFGKGRHPAGLNMGDCFAYACAHRLSEPLLCKGNDFPRTDIALA